MTGYVPSLETFTLVSTVAEEGQQWLKGTRQVPLRFGWLAPGDPPYDELPMRVKRIAYREFGRNPDLALDAFWEILGRDLFGANSTRQAVEDALELQAAFNLERTWCQPSPPTSPERVRAMKGRGNLTAKNRNEYRSGIDRLRAIERGLREPTSFEEGELRRIVAWAIGCWEGEAGKLFDADRRSRGEKWPASPLPTGGPGRSHPSRRGLS